MKGLIYKDWLLRKKAMLIFAALYSLPFFILFGVINEDTNSHFVYVFQ